MRALMQRVSKASVEVDGEVVGSIAKGWLLLVGFSQKDTEKDIDYIYQKAVSLRLFSDKDGKFNLSAEDINAQILLVSQFTLYADTKKGKRPSFAKAAQGELARSLWLKTVEKFRESSLKIETGVFGASMKVSLENDGPVTLQVESPLPKEA